MSGNNDNDRHLRADERGKGTEGTFVLEIAAYERELQRLLQQGEANRFALLHGDQLISIWDTYRDATQAGYQAFGREGWAVKEIDPRDQERLERLHRQRGG